MQTLSFTDNIIIIVYFVFIIGIGLVSGLLRKSKSSDGFFLAGRSLNWVMIGTALFAANISTTHLVGLVEQGFRDGMIWGNFEWFAFPGLILLSLVFAPIYYKSRISTLPEFLEKRYGHRTRTMLGIISIMFAIFAHIGISLYAGAVIFENFFGINFWTSIFVICIGVLIYTIIGGLKAVVVTEFIQTIILVLGTITMAVLALTELPEMGITSIADFKEAVKPTQLSVINGPEEANLPFISLLLGLPVFATYFFISDQTIVQKVLGAKRLKDAQTGPLFTGFLKILPVFMMIFPGIIAYVLYGDIITDSKDALPVLITNILPSGMRGLLAAALMAALMSTIAAGLNSTGTLVSIDIVKRIRPQTTDKMILRIGRITIFVVITSAMIWSPLIARFKSIFEAINVILVVLAPPVTTVMLYGVFWKRANRQGAFITMVTGLILGIIVFMLEFEPISGCRYITETCKIPFMMQAWWLFVIDVVIFNIVTRFFPKPPEEKTAIITQNNLHYHIFKKKISHFADPRVVAIILIVIMAMLYYIFR